MLRAWVMLTPNFIGPGDRMERRGETREEETGMEDARAGRAPMPYCVDTTGTLTLRLITQ